VDQGIKNIKRLQVFGIEDYGADMALIYVARRKGAHYPCVRQANITIKGGDDGWTD